MSKLMEGKKIAKEGFLNLEREMREKRISLSLAVFRVGEDPVSEIYVDIKRKELEKRGIAVSVYNFEEDVPEEELERKIKSTEEDGVIVQLPLPERLDKKRVLNFIPEEKDVDVLSSKSQGKFYSGIGGVLPPVGGAVQMILDVYNVTPKGKLVTLVGAGRLVGKPLVVFFIRRRATVSVVNQHTKDMSFFTKNADIVVSGAGVPGLIKGDMVKQGAILIDAGTSFVSGKTKGDVDIDSVKNKAGIFSPVPGGVGPLTVYCLAKNLFHLKTTKNEY